MDELIELNAYLESKIKQGLLVQFLPGRINISSRTRGLVAFLTYTIDNFNIVTYPLRKRDISKEEKAIYITFIEVNEASRGQSLGTLLLLYALMIGIVNDCTYSVLEDMSDNAREITKNIYASLGYTHKYVSEQKDGAVENTLPDKQLKLPSTDKLLAIAQKKFEGGRTRRKRRRSIQTRFRKMRVT